MNKIKNVVIYGDSYSTFEGCIPKGYAPYYTKSGERMPDVKSEKSTWWHMLAEELSLNIVENNSWSGSTISYTGRDGDCSANSSFIFRAKQHIEKDFLKQNNVDTVIVFGATNDSWIDVPLGELKFSGIEREELYSVIPAISYLVELLKGVKPEINVIYVLNSELKPEINEAVFAICEHYGVSLVELRDIDKMNGHPTSIGMSQIKEQVKDCILCNTRK